MTEEEIWQLIDEGETTELECKQAEGGLPKDMWSTYSAFANTNGGIILLGVREDRKTGIFTPQNVDTNKLMKDFWDNINNPQKISWNILNNEDVTPVQMGDATILKIVVPRATREQKPVYQGQNPYIGTYRRNYEGDYRCSENEVNRMIAEKTSAAQDSYILENYTMDDLDKTSFKSYRQRFATLKPDNHWNEVDDKEFLRLLGGWKKDRKENKEGLTVAGLLMFGKETAITEYFPHYFLDYREKISTIPDQRWSHRITSQDGNWSGNLYDFYFKVIGRLTADINVPFLIEGDELMRQSDTRVHKALREAVLNTLIHADYHVQGNILIEKEKNVFKFSNPGTLRISVEKAIAGGHTDPRNPIIFRMFAQLGLGERSGYGLESIHSTWKQQHWRKPALEEEFQPEKVTLLLFPDMLLPKDVLELLEFKLGSRYKTLSSDEVLALVIAYEEKSITNTRLQSLTNKHSQEILKVLSTLVDEEFLVPEGYGRGTRYVLSDFFNFNNEDERVEFLEFKYKKSLAELGIEDADARSVEEKKNLLQEKTGLKGEMIGLNKKNIGPNEKMIGPNEKNNDLNDGMLILNKETSRLKAEKGNTEEQDEVMEHLQLIAEPARNKMRLNYEKMEAIILKLCLNQYLTIKELSELLNRDSDSLRKRYITPLLQANKLELLYPENPRHKKQAYKTKA
ncbi:predicted HTH transcriptional regulator [Ureibacillus xyleni]|uniref:Predicted HTH transcriptional regulator n=1 Tax=Ureibacillus xyleni TaxID=614648 RepID=A0A285R925_9BACL|nr:RNA-binding domain-containing protein [Ureibacillus xyleni]SOB90603.1 predicted HTH transcriptional regulator [Ureibacillus xyleni]